ncbi:MAG: hypothetical protein M0Z27_07355 [Thermaerobacter sp.]|nr:hypothetical protein [Thermaerobacter sp.]
MAFSLVYGKKLETQIRDIVVQELKSYFGAQPAQAPGQPPPQPPTPATLAGAQNFLQHMFTGGAQGPTQLMAQAQFELAQELETNLQKLKQVIQESQDIAHRIETVLGKEQG